MNISKSTWKWIIYNIIKSRWSMWVTSQVHRLCVFASGSLYSYGNQVKTSKAAKKLFWNLGLKMQSFNILTSIIKTLIVQITNPKTPFGFWYTNICKIKLKSPTNNIIPYKISFLFLDIWAYPPRYFILCGCNNTVPLHGKPCFLFWVLETYIFS